MWNLWNQTMSKPLGFLSILNVHIKLPFIQIHTVAMPRRFKVQNIHIKLPFIQTKTVTMLRRFKVQNIKYNYTYWITLYLNTYSNNA